MDTGRECIKRGVALLTSQPDRRQNAEGRGGHCGQVAQGAGDRTISDLFETQPSPPVVDVFYGKVGAYDKRGQVEDCRIVTRADTDIGRHRGVPLQQPPNAIELSACR
jgi:hypothetical protein